MSCGNIVGGNACGGEFVSAGAPISTGGATLYPRRCQKCGFFYSDKKPLSAAPASAPDGSPDPGAGQPLAGEPAGNSQAPVEKILTAADGFDQRTLQVGDVVIFADRDGQQKRLSIVSTAKKTVLGDVDGKPDQRIRRDEILGVVVRE